MKLERFDDVSPDGHAGAYVWYDEEGRAVFAIDWLQSHIILSLYTVDDTDNLVSYSHTLSADDVIDIANKLMEVAKHAKKAAGEER